MNVTATGLLMLPSGETGNLMAGTVSTILTEITLPEKKEHTLFTPHIHRATWQFEPVALSPKLLEKECAVTRAKAKGSFQPSHGQLDVRPVWGPST